MSHDFYFPTVVTEVVETLRNAKGGYLGISPKSLFAQIWKGNFHKVAPGLAMNLSGGDR